MTHVSALGSGAPIGDTELNLNVNIGKVSASGMETTPDDHDGRLCWTHNLVSDEIVTCIGKRYLVLTFEQAPSTMIRRVSRWKSRWKKETTQNMTRQEAQAQANEFRGSLVRNFRRGVTWHLTSNGTGACRGKAAMQRKRRWTRGRAGWARRRAERITDAKSWRSCCWRRQHCST